MAGIGNLLLHLPPQLLLLLHLVSVRNIRIIDDPREMRVEPKLMVVMILVVLSREKNTCPSREHPGKCLGLEQGGSRGALLPLLLVLLGHTVKILLDIIIVAGAVVLMILLLHNGMIHHNEAPAALMESRE